MSIHDKSGIVFQVETSRILEILAREIYDSPNALLRENVQNAYDAVLMRAEVSEFSLDDARIDVIIQPDLVSIRDNGIGMDETALRENYWRAGSSGKRGDAARRAGVVGTFGIGAMANFGVAERITVRTRTLGSGTTLVSSAVRSELAIQEECIRLKEDDDLEFDVGTVVRADLDSENRVNVREAVDYLRTFVRFLPVDVWCNGSVISRESFRNRFSDLARNAKDLGQTTISTDEVQFELTARINDDGQVMAELSGLAAVGDLPDGNAFLAQGRPPLMGLRNYFGLAPIPTGGTYQFGGYVNAAFLRPTAGREALNRDSLKLASEAVSRVEEAVSTMIADTKYADKNTAFQEYARRKGKVEWARHITVRMEPLDKTVPLGELGDWSGKQPLHYYQGRRQEDINLFASPQQPLLVVSSANPRRALQLQYIRQVLRLAEIPDKPQVGHVFQVPELDFPEASFLVKISAHLIEEYLVSAEVHLAEISHGVTVLVEEKDSDLWIYVSRDHPDLPMVLESYRSAPDAFGALVRDFVRVHLYKRISDWVPSATKQGADALIAHHRRTRELYRYDEAELGALEPLLSDLLSGEADVGEVLRRAGRRGRPQPQRVSKGQVGSVERELGDVIQTSSEDPPSLDAAPPILRQELDTPMKILTSDSAHSALNGFKMLLGLSNKLFRQEEPFFHNPHFTKVMWAQHRIVYVFTHATGLLSLYYDIELPDPVLSESQGGRALPTTTLVTNRRIFVPVPDVLSPSFELVEGERKFHVRFDVVAS